MNQITSITTFLFRLFILIIWVGQSVSLSGQEILTQNIRGTVVDQSTQMPLIGATIILVDSDPLLGTVTNKDGEFILVKVPVGRQSVRINYMGYHQATVSNLNLVSGKELVLWIEMEEKVIMGEEITIRAYSRKDQPINEMATVSARSFTVEETEKYAGSLGDPARMAMNFAGVMAGADQINDIIIRGNSPIGLLWRLEGIHIPNPNHFSSLGSTGGPISMLNNNVLNNSDFYTGAFPAEYGNALSGVFDLRLRTGNNKKREYTAQVGLNGAEFGVEGPIIKEWGNSYIAHYRYSTLAALHLMGLNIGVMAIPYYQDLSFKLDFRTKKSGRWSAFGIGGLNHITLEDKESDTYDFLRLSSESGVLGINHMHFINNTTRIKTGIAVSAASDHELDSVWSNGNREKFYWDLYTEIKYSFTSNIRKKFNPRNLLIAGIDLDLFSVTYRDSIFSLPSASYFHTIDIKDNLLLIQAYSHWKHKFSDELTIISGLHYQQTTLNNELSLEPRLSLNWNVTKSDIVSFGYGLHSQVQPRLIYFEETLLDTTNVLYGPSNQDLGFTKSHHFVLGYQHRFNPNLRVKSEVYYQRLFNIPVKATPSWISLINYGRSFSYGDYDSLVNEGTGRNIGLECTLEHFFASNYYYLVTLSLFDSKYVASDNKTRNTAFNGNFILNILGGYEFHFRKQNSFSTDFKTVWAGGLRSIPIDLNASRTKGETVYDYSNVYKDRYDNYFRLDIRLSYHINRTKVGHMIALDIQNITNRYNRFLETYNPDTDKIEQEYQLGILPIVLYRVYF